ncbi:hypothetical protein PG997_002748 [Apiospora hydei]|uniref:Uncharacterized protein n=1 Tax=Apiospora hydei TaxID=1337664 RepID=A0ABR1WXA0_9PEZI
MMELYPDAKVVFARRDPQGRWDSIKAATARAVPLWLGIAATPISGRSTFCLAVLDPVTATPSDLMLHEGPRKYLGTHLKRVKSILPEGQLLEMDLNDRWGPLCQFLAVPMPDTPFPRVNDAETADRYATKVIAKALHV